jgi:hypothetical protein
MVQPGRRPAGVNYVVTYDTKTDDSDGLYATALPMDKVEPRAA